MRARTFSLVSLAGAVGLALLPGLAHAKEPKARGGPEAAFGRWMEAIRTSDWETCAEMMHPEALQEVQRLVTTITQESASPELTRRVLGVEKSEAATLSSQAAFVHLLQNYTSAPAMADLLRGADVKVIGTVHEGDVVHVVFRTRMTLEGMPFSKVQVAPFKPDDGKWRMLLNGTIEGMLQALQRNLHDREPVLREGDDAKTERAGIALELERLNTAVKADPEDAASWTKLANLHQDAELYKEAIPFYESASALRPNDPNVLTDLGVCYRAIGQQAKALELFKRAEASDPSHWQSLYNQVIVYAEDLNKVAEAEATLMRLEKTKPDAPRLEDLRTLVKEARAGSEPPK